MNRAIMLSILALAVCCGAAPAEVTIREEALSLPTYRIGRPEPLPFFQARFGRIYPYPLFDRLTDDRADRSYRALWLENEYVKALVLPEIGGRLHGA